MILQACWPMRSRAASPSGPGCSIASGIEPQRCDHVKARFIACRETCSVIGWRSISWASSNRESAQPLITPASAAVLSVCRRHGVHHRARALAAHRPHRLGKTIRAAAVNPNMVAALGINTGYLYGLVFALGGLLAGFAGALAAPMRSLTPGMGFTVLIESFIVTVVGGMGSIIGAFVAALAIGLIRAFGSLGFPLFTDGLMYLFMVLILIARPTGLFGKEIA